MLTILPPDEHTWPHLHQADARYLAGELVQVRVTRKGFQPEYAPMPTAEWRTSTPPSWLTKEYITGHDDWACFFAFQEKKYAGQVIVQPVPYGLCKLLDIRVDASLRRQAIGMELLNTCAHWAKRKGMQGLWAEISDQNPVACQFFQNSGFVLGGVDKLRRHADPLQAGRPASLRDSVLSFYQFFPDGGKK